MTEGWNRSMRRAGRSRSSRGSIRLCPAATLILYGAVKAICVDCSDIWAALIEAGAGGAEGDGRAGAANIDLDACTRADVSCRFVRREIDLDPRTVLQATTE